MVRGILRGAPVAVLGAATGGQGRGRCTAPHSPGTWGQAGAGRREHPGGQEVGRWGGQRRPRLDPGGWVKGVATCVFGWETVGGGFGVRSELGCVWPLSVWEEGECDKPGRAEGRRTLGADVRRR